MKIIFSFLFLTITSIFSPAFSAELEWEVVQPFRFLRYESDHTVHEMAFKAAQQNERFRTNRVSAMESLLNNPTWWDTRLSDLEASPAETISTLRQAEGRKPEQVDPRLGWSALLRTEKSSGVADGTCWEPRNQSFFNCRSIVGDITGGNQYTFPKHHIVKIKPDAKYQGKTCLLEITSELTGRYGFLENNKTSESEEQESVTFNCSTHILARVQFNNPMTVELTVEGTKQGEAIIKVRDFVVASLGDSFASGEGNPDFPAKLDPQRTITPRFSPSNGTSNSNFGVPRRAGYADGKIASYSSADWLDRRCHRSMYSAHTRAAIALALSGNRHHAITYISFACSGAEITDGLFWPQDGRECIDSDFVRKSGTRFMEPQIGALVGALGQNAGDAMNPKPFTNTLSSNDRFREEMISKFGQSHASIRRERDFCGNWPGKNRLKKNPSLRAASLKREIDILFLHIGGNDMGFTPLVMSTVLTSGVTALPFNDIGARLYNFAAGGISAQKAEENIGALSARYEMLNRAFKEKLEINDPSRVLLSAYPTPAYDENGNFCDTGRKGMNASRLLRLSGPESNLGLVNIKKAQGIVNKLNAKVKNAAKMHGFTYVNSFQNEFKTHGVCAQNGNSNAEKMDLPYKQRGDSSWKVFNPATEFYPYASRQRWFRTFNDSYLAMYHFKGNAYDERPREDGSAFYLAFRTLGGPVHPSAEGHASMADSLYCAAAKQLLSGQDDALCE